MSDPIPLTLSKLLNTCLTNIIKNMMEAQDVLEALEKHKNESIEQKDLCEMTKYIKRKKIKSFISCIEIFFFN